MDGKKHKYSHDRVITIYSKISVSILKYLFLDLLSQHSFMSWKEVKESLRITNSQGLKSIHFMSWTWNPLYLNQIHVQFRFS